MLTGTPNLLTLGRVLAVPALAAAFYLPGDVGKWTTCVIFSLARDHRLLRRLSGAELVDAVGLRAHARSDRRQAAGGGGHSHAGSLRPARRSCRPW